MLVPLLVAISAISTSQAPQWPPLSGTFSNTGLGKNDVALVAGVSRSFVLPEVPGAAETATDWYRFFVEGRGVPVDHAVLLRDGDVTRESLLAEAERLRKMRGPGGVFWIVFVGHGAAATTGDDGLLLGADVQPTIRSLEARGLPQQALLKAAGGQDVVAVFDACFSGVRSDGSGAPLVPGAQATVPVRRSKTPPRMTILSASDVVAGPLPGHNRPAFSYLLLGGLRGWADGNGDGVVQLGDAFDYAKRVLTVAVRDRNQTPTFSGSGKDLVVHKNARERGPDLGQALVGLAVRAEGRPMDTVRRDDTFDRVAAEEAFNRVRVVATRDGFVRGQYAQAVESNQVVEAGKRVAPDAAATVAEVEGRYTNAVWVGIGVGALTAVLGAVGVGLLIVGTVGDPGDPAPAVVGAGLGSGLGLAGGAIAWGVAQPSDADEARLNAARSDLAEALNNHERRRLGL